jgi:hypothetical protein
VREASAAALNMHDGHTRAHTSIGSDKRARARARTVLGVTVRPFLRCSGGSRLPRRDVLSPRCALDVSVRGAAPHRHGNTNDSAATTHYHDHTTTHPPTHPPPPSTPPRYDAGLNGRAPHHVETWRLMFSALTHEVPPKARPGGDEQLDLRRIEGRTGIQKVDHDGSSSSSNSSSSASSPAAAQNQFRSPSAPAPQQQQHQSAAYQQSSSGGGSSASIPTTIPDLDAEVLASEAEMIELELRNVRASMSRASGSFRDRLAEQERDLVRELEAERAKAAAAAATATIAYSQ